ncbi:MAG: DUF2088 domain-containing protein [Clostridia bacterium]|nr:DUF2088 domain-containing protein [Clostridia bacterium]
MKKIFIDTGVDFEELEGVLRESLSDVEGVKKALLIPPDFTRFHSCAGIISSVYYKILTEKGAFVELLPALGSHVPMTREECGIMFPGVPFERILVHNWRRDVVKIGEVPASFVRDVSEGVMDEPVPVEVNRRLISGEYDLMISVGQVVPHEVVGMANYSKNVFVGCGGSRMINASHILGAFYGMERLMGKDKSPVRRVFDYAQERFLKDLPLEYVLTVTTAPGGKPKIHGLFIGGGREGFERAVKLAQEKNLTFVDEPFKKVVVNLDESEFKSTWLGNKAIYRTRMAIADGGELIILAPGVDKFGEDPEIDGLIRKYGYCGREKVISLCKTREDLKKNMSAAAHLIHGSSDGRFKITYCTARLSKEEVEGACFGYLHYAEAVKKYDPGKLRDGYNTVGGEEIYYISNPALGLWADRAKF